MHGSMVGVGFHQKCSAVGMTEPRSNGWNIHAGLDACGCEGVAQVVVSEARGTDYLTRSCKTLLRLFYGQYRFVWVHVWFTINCVRSSRFTALHDLLQQCASGGN